MRAATKMKMSGSEKIANRNTFNISSIKRVTREFLEVSRYVVVVQNNFKEVYKKVCCTCKVVVVVVVLLIRPIDVFGYFCCRRRLALYNFLFCLSKL